MNTNNFSKNTSEETKDMTKNSGMTILTPGDRSNECDSAQYLKEENSTYEVNNSATESLQENPSSGDGKSQGVSIGYILKNILAFILSFVAVAIILLGTCILNVVLYESLNSIPIPLLALAWGSFVFALIVFVGRRTKLVGVKIALKIIVLILIWLLLFGIR
ncbi:MAG: hypothetical protein J6V70_09085 [Kiritimatiellae bacterium]|nr:hypothetical protein [Kiritimatiellia bacterium]